MLRWVSFCTFLSVALHGSVASFGEEQVEPARNAALSYWQGFALIPSLSESEQKLRDQVLNGAAVNEDVKRIVAKSEDSLRFLHRGAQLKTAAWGIAWDEGPYALLPHLSKARELTRLALVRARVRFAEHQPKEAVDDIIASMTLGRHLSREGVIVLIPLLVDYAIESQSIEMLATHLRTLDAKTLAYVKQKLAALPPGVNLSKAMQGEKDVFLPWVIAELKKPSAKQ
ncbi:MAG: hypothetical protein KDA84_23425, partial [Planctomycetaceae bacterium]|nr:hypothetical protein [Planctomycetaceae bacterium]